MKDRDLPLPPRPPSRIPPRPRPRSYEEDMTPPRGMRNYRPEMTPGGVESFEEDMTPPAGMRNMNMKPRFEKKMKSGGKVKKMASGGSVKSSCQRGDGAAIKGKTKGKMV
jgi:hypothetical protein